MEDRSTNPAGAPKPAKRRPDPDQPPGLRAQLGATFAAGKRLFQAHVDLAKAELSEIVDEVKRMVALIGAAIGILVLAGLLFAIGLFLFLGEWLFGSIGWGVLLGTLLLVDIAIVAVLLALDVAGRRLGTAFVIGAIVGGIVGVVFALDLTHRGWTALGDAARGLLRHVDANGAARHRRICRCRRDPGAAEPDGRRARDAVRRHRRRGGHRARSSAG